MAEINKSCLRCKKEHQRKRVAQNCDVRSSREIYRTSLWTCWMSWKIYNL